MKNNELKKNNKGAENKNSNCLEKNEIIARCKKGENRWNISRGTRISSIIIASNYSVPRKGENYMTAPTHKIGGLALGCVAIDILQLNIVFSSVLLGSALLGSLLPDIDNFNSSISHRWRLLSIVTLFFQSCLRILAGFCPRKLRDRICSMIGHRGLTHSAIMLILPLAITIIAKDVAFLQVFGFGIAVGLTSHIVLDMFSGGVPLFMPFITTRFKLAHVKTGGVFEWMCRIGLSFLLIYQISNIIKELL